MRGLAALARAHGAGGETALDVACGTGTSTAALLELGYRVTGVDAVEAMLACAREKLGDRVALHRTDMAELPVLGAFDLVTCLNDAVNHLGSPARLTSALAAMAANLRPGGVLVFDTNTPVTYGSFFAATHTLDADGGTVVWAGGGFDPRTATATATLTLPDGATRPHVQHHHEPADVTRAVRAAGLDLAAGCGQHDDGRRDPFLDPAVHTKAVWVCRRPGPATHKEVSDEGQEEPEGGDARARHDEGGLSARPSRERG